MGATTWKKAERIIWEVVNTDEVKVIEACLVSRYVHGLRTLVLRSSIIKCRDFVNRRLQKATVANGEWERIAEKRK